MVFRQHEDADGTRHYVGRNVVGGGRTVRFTLSRVQRRHGNLLGFLVVYPVLGLIGVLTWFGLHRGGVVGAIVAFFLALGAVALVCVVLAVAVAVRGLLQERAVRRHR